MARTSQREIAERLGVAQITVSKALRGDRDISEATKGRVRAMASELGYVANAYARCLAEGTSKTVGILIPRCRGKHCSSLLETLERELACSGHLPLLAMEGDDERDGGLIQTFLGYRVAGLLLCVKHADWTPPELACVQASGTPLVLLGKTSLPDVCSVCADDRRGVMLAFEHLVSQGHRRILMLGWPVAGNSVAALRVEAFKDAVAAAGLERECQVVESTYDTDAAAVRAAFGAGATFSAVLCLGDERAFTVFDALSELGLAVPGDVSVMGYGDDVEYQERMRVPLTTMSHDPVEMGRRAVELLFRQIKKERIECPSIEVENHLVARNSVRRI